MATPRVTDSTPRHRLPIFAPMPPRRPKPKDHSREARRPHEPLLARHPAARQGAAPWDKQTLASLLRGSLPGVQFNAHLTHRGDIVFAHACKMGLEGIVSKRLGSSYRSGRTSDWLKFKNPEAPAVQREAEEDWGKRRWR